MRALTQIRTILNVMSFSLIESALLPIQPPPILASGGELRLCVVESLLWRGEQIRPRRSPSGCSFPPLAKRSHFGLLLALSQTSFDNWCLIPLLTYSHHPYRQLSLKVDSNTLLDAQNALGSYKIVNMQFIHIGAIPLHVYSWLGRSTKPGIIRN